jgi:hypothetical protein
MSNLLGFYRYKLASVSAAGNTVQFKLNGVIDKTCTITPVNLCTGKRILKYLNRDGQYRFFPFISNYEELDKPKEIGKTLNIIASILSSKSDTKSVGYKSDRTINLKSDPISTAQLEILRDIYTSPRVYLYVGTTTDTESDWVLVSVQASKSIRKEPKAKFTTLEIEVTLPETYAITML